MANTKISALTSATTPLAGTETLPVVQSSTTVKVTVANLTAGRSVSMADATLSTGNLTLSTAAKGVNFTANTPAAGMTSQLLNWYEEGTYTVQFYDAITGGNASATSFTGFYTRTGRSVTVTFSSTVGIDTTGMTLTNTLYMTLPFTPSSTAGQGSCGNVILRNVLFTGYNFVVPYVQVGAGRGIFRKVVSGGTDNPVVISDLTSGTARIFYYSITYFV